ncbi:hypothetical protein JW979_01125, partial [bacterium]|nr:hypothetical protein [candidate division CSSED10-310 bacterium]
GKPIAGLLLTAVGIFSIRGILLHTLTTSATSVYFHYSLASWKGIVRYLHWLVLPWPIAFTKQLPLIVLLGILIYALPLYFVSTYHLWRKLALSGIWITCAFIPISGAPANWYMHLPSIGFMVGISVVIDNMKFPVRQVFAGLLLLLCVIFTGYWITSYRTATIMTQKILGNIQDLPNKELGIIGLPRTFVEAPMLTSDLVINKALSLHCSRNTGIVTIAPIVIDHQTQAVEIIELRDKYLRIETSDNTYPFFWSFPNGSLPGSDTLKISVISFGKFGKPKQLLINLPDKFPLYYWNGQENIVIGEYESDH